MRRAAALLLTHLAACHDPLPTTRSSAREALDPHAAFASSPALDAAQSGGPCPTAAQRLGDGLTAERQPLGAAPALGLEPCFDVVRADAAHYHLALLTKAQDGTSQPATGWRERYHLTAVTNAGMFHANGNPVGLVVTDGTPLTKDHPKFGGYIVFDPRSPSDPPIAIAGRDCPNFDLAALQRRYKSLLQANRLLGCNGEALPWLDTKQYSAAAIAVDHHGNPVFIHSRAAVTMSQLARAVATLDLAGALFLEGGPEASLVVRGSEGELSRVGSYESGFVENDENKSFWWLSNVLALAPN